MPHGTSKWGLCALLGISLRSTSKSELPLLAQGHAHEWLHKSIKYADFDYVTGKGH